MIGCINILKMNVLPTFLYLFQSIHLSPQEWKVGFVSLSEIIEGLGFAYICFISPMKEEVWDFQTFNGNIGRPNFLLPPTGFHQEHHYPG